MHEDVRINISPNTWNGYTAENQEERLFFNEAAFLFWCHALWKLESSERPKRNFGETGLPPLISRSGWPHPPPPLPLIWRSGWPHPTPSPLSEGLDPPLYNWSLTSVVFKLGSKVNCVCYGFATPHGDWLLYLTKHGPLFQPKRSKTKTNRDLHAHALALCASIIHVIASSSCWFMSLFAPVVIGHSSYCGFGFTKLTWPIFHAMFLLCRGPKHSFPSKKKTYRCSSFKVQAASFCKNEGYHFCILTSAMKIVYSPCVTWPKIARNFGIVLLSLLLLAFDSETV